MAMPKATLHLDDLATPWEHNVWSPWKVSDMKSESIPHCMQ